MMLTDKVNKYAVKAISYSSNIIKRKYKLANWIHDDLIFISNSLLKKK